MSKGNPHKINANIAIEALSICNGDRKAAFSRYIQLMYRHTGNLAPGCDNKDLQAFYDAKPGEG